MDVQTDSGSAVLPREGQLIEFVVDGYDVAIVGTYAQRAFRSQRSAYAIELVDASNDESIRCCVWAFESPEEAECVQRATTKAIGLGAPIDEVLARTGFARHAAQGSFQHAQAVVEFLAKDIDPALRANARSFLQEMKLVGDSEPE